MRQKRAGTAEMFRVEALAPGMGHNAVTVVVYRDGSIRGCFTDTPSSWSLWEKVDASKVTEGQLADWLAARGYVGITASVPVDPAVQAQ